ncbi:hypothetical protein [Alteribacillus sp. YIM 98480]|uniref:hypothetical protein n=1 Tax=Alteribacillus sp. YIM 98480 TaxID=2606599 RepID=UPI00131D0967|nr:hypothetical protein [Alteribacillus sp. YIM 98480]
MVSYNIETIYKTFTAEKAKGMEEFFNYYNEYVEVFWKTSNGQIKKVFRANSNKGFSEREQITSASVQLLNKLDRHLAFFL